MSLILIFRNPEEFLQLAEIVSGEFENRRYRGRGAVRAPILPQHLKIALENTPNADAKCKSVIMISLLFMICCN